MKSFLGVLASLIAASSASAQVYVVPISPGQMPTIGGQATPETHYFQDYIQQQQTAQAVARGIEEANAHQAYIQSQQQFYSEAGSALGAGLAALVERAKEQHALRVRNREFANQSLLAGDCAAARAYAASDKQMLAMVEKVCAERDAALRHQYEAQVAAFAADPAHPRFQELRVRMGALLREGRTNDLQQAYDMAAAETVAAPTPAKF